MKFTYLNEKKLVDINGRNTFSNEAWPPSWHVLVGLLFKKLGRYLLNVTLLGQN